MGLIHIKNRKEPIRVSNDRAAQVKKIRFGTVMPDGSVIGKADPRDDLDLGGWCGEIGQVRAVEIEPEVKARVDDSAQEDEEVRKRNESWLRQTPEKKAEHMEYFKICWSSRHGFARVEIPRDVLDKAYKIQVEYYRQNPRALMTPSEKFNAILPPKKGSKTLAEKMKVNLDDIPA